MEQLCPLHQVEFRLVPAGTSKKTGKPYQAFYACPEMGCKERPGPASDWKQSVPADIREPRATTLVKEEKPDWDEIAKGKVRHGVVCALIQAGRDKDQISKEMDYYVSLIMGERPF